MEVLDYIYQSLDAKEYVVAGIYLDLKIKCGIAGINKDQKW